MDQVTEAIDDRPATIQAAVELPHADARSEAERVLAEIERAAGLAEESLAKDAELSGAAGIGAPADAGGQAVNDAEKAPEELAREKEAAREARLAFLVKRAKSQKERGRAQLERVVVGAMAIRKDVEFFDVNIASSAERFLGLVDLAFYTINRRGEYVLGEKGAADVIDRLTTMATLYRENAVNERAQAVALLKNEQELSFDTDWIVPEYRQTAFQMAVYIKHPATLNVLEGLFAYDALIRTLTVLQWNGKVDQVRIDQARQQERRALSLIHQFSGRSLIGLNRRARPAARASAPRESRQSAPAEYADTPLAA